jgi:hypothetical protein
LTVSTLWRNGDLSFVDRGMTARVTATGATDVVAVRAAAVGVAPGELFRLGLCPVAG